MLFALYVVDWGKALESSGEGIMLGSVKVAALFFADDVVLISSTAVGLVRTQQQSEAESVKSYLEARGLRAQPKGRGPRGRILLAQLSSAAGFIILVHPPEARPILHVILTHHK